jgi:SAM-dependent methyltransferase
VLFFLRKYGKGPLDDRVLAKARDLSIRSAPDPSRPQALTFVGELFAETTIRYQSLDIFRTPFTRVFDLNFESLPEDMTGRFDLVVNCGTTEHVFGQYNAFQVMHDAVRRGGHFFHQLPATGFFNHGYFTYHPRVFGDLAAANGYAIVELSYSDPQGYGVIEDGCFPPPNLADPAAFRASVKRLAAETPTVPNGLLNALLRKDRSRPFRVALETRSSIDAPDSRIAGAYKLVPRFRAARRVLKALGVKRALRALRLW